MKIAHIGKGSDTLQEVPKPPVYLNDRAKEHYKKMGSVLAKTGRLKEMYLPALEVYAEAMDQWEYAVRQIREMNREVSGSGYVQTYSTGAKNITTELVIRDRAISILWDCFKQFGLDPKSDKALKDTTDPNQLDIFKQMQKALQSAG